MNGRENPLELLWKSFHLYQCPVYEFDFGNCRDVIDPLSAKIFSCLASFLFIAKEQLGVLRDQRRLDAGKLRVAGQRGHQKGHADIKRDALQKGKITKMCQDFSNPGWKI